MVHYALASLKLAFSCVIFTLCLNPCGASKTRNYMPQPEDEYDDAFKQFMDDISRDEPCEPIDLRELDYKHVEHKECVTTECKKQAEVIKNSMNDKIDPCSNFFDYACGGFVKKPIPPERSYWNNFAVLYQKNENKLRELIEGVKGKTDNKALKMAYDFYSACMDVTRREKLGNEPLLTLIKSLGSWPVNDNNWNAKNWDLLSTIAAVHRLDIMPIFTVGLGVDPRNSSSPYRLEISPQKPLLGAVSFYLEKHMKYAKKIRYAYFELMVHLTAELSPNKKVTHQIIREMGRVFLFEKQLARLLQNQKNKEKQTHTKKLYIITLDKLQSKKKNKLRLTKMKWKAYFNHLYDGLKQKPITDSEIVMLEEYGYLKTAFEIVATTDKRVLANFIIWSVVYELAPALTNTTHELYMKFYKAKYGIKEDTDLWRRCVRATDKTIDMAVSRLFVNNTFSEKSKKMADQTIGYIRNAFINNLQTINWMDNKTKQAAKEKAKAMFQQVGYPAFIYNDTLLNLYFDGLEVNSKKHFQNVVNNKAIRMNNTLRARGKVPSKRTWGMRPSQVNAYYENLFNKIVVPAGILQPPFFHESFPNSWRFGAIGFTTGHELTHGFDNNGCNYDKNGNLKNWWSKTSRKHFLARSNCIKKQYSTYTMYNEHVNGLQTLGENIADNGGLKLAHMAYHKWRRKNKGRERTFPGLSLPPEKLFFLGFAQMWCSNATLSSGLASLKTDVHSPGRVRVLGVLSNSKEFAKAFKCPKRSRMNPDKKCLLW